MGHRFGAICVAALLTALVLPLRTASAEDSYVIGIPAGLTGYTATIAQSWVGGAKIAVAAINAQGGVLGKKVALAIDDTQALPQEAVAVYTKMMGSDNVQAFASDCFSAGNFAAAPIVIRKKLPMVVCSILPKQDNLVHWMFSTIPKPAFEVEPRLAYLAAKTNIRKIGVILDESPYANAQTEVVKELAPKYKLEIVGIEKYRQTDSDLSIQIKKLQAEGALAIIKNGDGPSTLLAARAIRELGLNIPMLTSNEDLEVFREVAAVMGKDFFFPATPPQIYDSLPDSDPAKKPIGAFLEPWKKAHGEADPNWASRGYDAIQLLVTAVRNAKTTDGEKVRDALDKIHEFQGAASRYNFDVSHYGVTENPVVLARYIDGRLVIEK